MVANGRIKLKSGVAVKEITENGVLFEMREEGQSMTWASSLLV